MLEIVEEGPGSLPRYGEVSIAFRAEEILQVAVAAGEVRMNRCMVPAFRKDYDALAEHRPADWPRRFDVSGWGILAARMDGRRVGGAVVVREAPDLLESPDEALLWDLRVAPGVRGRGIGAALFRAAERWAAGRGARRLVVETQNVNAAACRFYARQGCGLVSVDPFAYADLPDEVQLLWAKDLVASAPAR